MLNWNNYKDTKECMESLGQVTYPNYEVVVVDNCSADDSTRKIQKEFPDFKYIYNKDNLGFTGGNNAGLKYATDGNSEFFLVLNNDIIVDKFFLGYLVEAMLEDKSIGIVGSLNYDYYEPEKIISAGRKMSYLNGNATHILEPADNQRELDAIWGCCMLIRREVFEKIGYFYEPYFFSFEEIDFCVKAKKEGFKIVCEPKSKIWHKVSNTIGKMSAFGVYYGYRNKLLFVKRNYPVYIKWPFYSYYIIYVFLKSIIYKIKGNKKMAFATKSALFDFINKKFGRNSAF